MKRRLDSKTVENGGWAEGLGGRGWAEGTGWRGDGDRRRGWETGRGDGRGYWGFEICSAMELSSRHWERVMTRFSMWKGQGLTWRSKPAEQALKLSPDGLYNLGKPFSRRRIIRWPLFMASRSTSLSFGAMDALTSTPPSSPHANQSSRSRALSSSV